MAKTIIKNFSQAPYYDDFDESKNYHRILFRPGVSVQARELTQLQTLLQAQIDRHGQYAFKDGSRVVGGKVTVNVKYDFESATTPQPPVYTLDSIPLPATFGSAVFGVAEFGAAENPLVRQAVEGTGNTVALRIKSDDQNSPYSVNGFYIDYMPAGRK